MAQEMVRQGLMVHKSSGEVDVRRVEPFDEIKRCVEARSGGLVERGAIDRMDSSGPCGDETRQIVQRCSQKRHLVEKTTCFF